MQKQNWFGWECIQQSRTILDSEEMAGQSDPHLSLFSAEEVSYLNNWKIWTYFG